MEFTLVNRHSPMLEKVIQLGDQNRATLGFLPRQAFEEYAGKNHIIAFTDGADLVAYLLYRTKNSVAIIVHLCVAQNYRKTSCAKQLVERLMEVVGETIATIQLACRRDYGLDNFWYSAGFHPVSERAGRATKESSTLTTWIRSNPNCHNLFTQEIASSSKTPVLLDTNIVIDLFNRQNEESNALTADFLLNYVQFYVPASALTEINSNPDDCIRRECLRYAREKFEVAEVAPSRLDKVRNEILQIRPACAGDNTWFDISNIANAIVFGSSYFITRDAAWLNTDVSTTIHNQYGLLIMSPGEFICCIDEFDSPEDYSPIKLYGLGLEWGKLSADSFSGAVDLFYSNFGKKRAFQSYLRQKMAATDNEVRVARLKGELAAISCIEYTDTKSVVSLLYINSKMLSPSVYPTFVKWITSKLFEDAQQKQKQIFEIPTVSLPEDVGEVLRNSNLFATKDSFFRVVLPQIVPKTVFEDVFIRPNPNLNSDSIKESDGHFAWNIYSEYNIERMLSPLKLTPSSLPTYIVPITGNYAKELFDEALADENPNFLETYHVLATLSDEKVYFKSPRKKISRFPARILWYVSQSEMMGTKQIRACSILDNVTTGSMKTVYKKYHRLGILDWNQLRSMVGNAEEITAYSFSCTELLKSPISLEEARRILGKPNEAFPSYREITESQFLDLYRQGTKCETP